MIRYRDTLELCDDWLFTAHIGWDESFTGLSVPSPTPLNRIPADVLIGYAVLDEDGYHSEGHYLASPCAGCGNPDAGTRTTTWVTYTHPCDSWPRARDPRPDGRGSRRCDA